MLDKARQHAIRCMEDSFQSSKEKWDNKHKLPSFKVGDMVLISTNNFNNIKGPKKLKNSFTGPFVIKALHGDNAPEVELSGELSRKHPTFPVSLLKPYQEADVELFPLRKEIPEPQLPPIEPGEVKPIHKILKDKKVCGNSEKLYLVRYRDNEFEDEWLTEKQIPNSDKYLRRYKAHKSS